MDQRAALTVSQLTRQVKDALEPRFTRVLVRGEISNFRGVNARGHSYFALTDARSSIDVKLWATTAAKLKFQIKDGLSVIIEGNLDVYEPQGRYSLIVEKLEPEGLGAQALRNEQLKQKLLAEGLIGDARVRPKRTPPFLPRRIGVVTSISGAALRDFLKVLHRRHPGISVLVADARVQGDGAVFELRRALRWLSSSDVDVIVVTRGGGSSDDLSVFSEEPVVRALWACPVPVVSAVGHEIDTTLCDLVADVRAPTPSAAAELLAPSLVELRATLATLKSRLHRGAEKVVMSQRASLKALERGLGDPRRELSSQRLVISTAADRMRAVLSRRTRTESAALNELKRRLIDPRHVIAAQRLLLKTLGEGSKSLVARRRRAEAEALGDLKARMVRSSPRALLQRRRETLAGQGWALRDALERRRRAERERLGSLTGSLLKRSPRAEIGAQRARLSSLARGLERHSPRQAIAREGAALEALKVRMLAAAARRHRDARQKFKTLEATLDALSPLKVLTRGYALATRAEHVVRAASDLKVGDQLRLRFADDSVQVTVAEPPKPNED